MKFAASRGELKYGAHLETVTISKSKVFIKFALIAAHFSTHGLPVGPCDEEFILDYTFYPC